MHQDHYYMGEHMLRAFFVTAIVSVAGFVFTPAIANAEPFENCSAARDAGYENIPSTSDFYGEWLDKDLDGVGCEAN